MQNYDSFHTFQKYFVFCQHLFLLQHTRPVSMLPIVTTKGDHTVPKRKALSSVEQSVFTEANIAAMAKDMKARRIPLDRTVLSDDLVTGLRVVIRKSGDVTYHASYHFGDERPSMILGVMDPDSPDHITLTEARELTKTVKSLADRGINPQDGLHRRLVHELLRDGRDWKPEKIPVRRRKQ